jgi:hypothetical protein
MQLVSRSRVVVHIMYVLQSRTQSHRWVALATRDWKTILIGRSISYWTHTPCRVHERGQYEWIRYILLSLARKFALFWRIFCCFSSEKVVKGLRSWLMHTWIHLGKITAFVMVIIHTLGSLWVSINGNDGICPWSTILECYCWKEIQAYKTYNRTRMLGLCLYKIWDFLIEL